MQHPMRTRLRAVAGAFVLALAANLGAIGAAPADEDHYRLGLSFLQRGMHDLAAKELEAYLESNPSAANSPTARYALATCLRQAKELDRAVKQLDVAISAGLFDFEPDARLLRAQCLFDLGKHEDSSRACQEIAAKHPKHALLDRAIVLHAESLFRLGKFEAAAQVVGSSSEVLAQSPQRPRARLIESMALLAAGSYAKGAESAAFLRREDSPYNARATLVEAQCRRRLEKPDAALSLFQEAARSDDNSIAGEAILAWSGTLRESGRPSDAIRVLDQAPARVSAAQQPAFALERARALFDAKDYERSLRVLFPLATEIDTPAQSEATHLAARCEMALGRSEAAISRLQALVDRTHDSPNAEVTLDLGLAHAQAKHDEQAASTLQSLLNQPLQPAIAAEALVALAQCQHNLSQPKDSFASCDAFLREHAEHASASTIRLLRAQCLDALGNPAAAAAAYEEFVKRDASDPRVSGALVSRGLLLIRTKQMDTAVAILTEAAKSSALTPADRTACLTALANASIATSDWISARQWLEQLREHTSEDSKSRDLTYRIGLCLAQSGDHASAAEQFARVASGDPESSLARQSGLEQGKSLFAIGRLDEARRGLERIASASSSDSLANEAKSVLSEIATRQGRTQDALDLLHASRASDRDAEPDAASRLREGALLLAAGHWDEAERTLRSLASMPSVPATLATEARARLAICIARQARHEEAEPLLRGALRDGSLDGELGRVVRFELGRACAALGRLEDAEREFTTLVGESPTITGAIASLELAHLRLGMTPPSSEHAQRALSHLETCARYQRALPSVPRDVEEQEAYLRGLCQSRLGGAEATVTLRRFVEQHEKSPLAPAAHLLLGQELGKRGEWAKASPHLESAVRLASDDQTRERASLLLGNARSESQQWAAAESTFNEYLRAYPTSELWFQARFGLGWARENAGKHGEAIEAYREVTVRHQGPTAARAQFQIGECLFALARHEDAVREFAKVEALYAYPEWTAAALYESGRCLQALGRPDDARRTMSDVESRFADTKWATLAREQLASKSVAPTPGRTTTPPAPHATSNPPKPSTSDRR